MPLAVRDWGLRPYPNALEEMRALRRARRSGGIPDTLLLVEHPPVVTVGVQGDDGEEFPAGVPVVRIERGGKGTYHGPGQLVGYPIVDLEARGRDVRKFVRELEELVIRALGDVGVEAGRVDGQRGVWVAGARKIASIGIAVESWVTSHGFALNVSTDLEPFRAFHPCGMPGTVMTSVSRELGRSVSVAELREPIVRAWESVFAAERAAGQPMATAPLAPAAP